MIDQPARRGYLEPFEKLCRDRGLPFTVQRHTILEAVLHREDHPTACHPGRGGRYDRQTDVHHHLVCLHCGRVIDISDERLDAPQAPDRSVEGFEVFDFRLQLRGICRSCRNEEEQP